MSPKSTPITANNLCLGSQFSARFFAVIAAKKTFPLAVQRNRVKRLARSIFRSQGELFPKGTALVLVARASMLRRRFADLEKTLALAAQRIQERQGPEVA